MRATRERGRPGDVPAALQFAARLPFRAGVSKTFVLVTCGGNPAQRDGAFFGDALTMAKEQNITVHHLTDGRFELRRGLKKSASRKMLGYNQVIGLSFFYSSLSAARLFFSVSLRLRYLP